LLAIPELWHFHKTVEVDALRERGLVSFPSGFARGLATNVIVEQTETHGLPIAKTLEWYQNAFANELRHFRNCKN
jgi:hypothetical protein